MMKTASFHILRVGMAITFLWIGILVFKEPTAWGGFLQPWVAELLPFSLKMTMLFTAGLDIILGVLFLIDYFVWPAALLASFHLLIILAVSGINAITVRDIGLLAGTISLFVASFKGRKK